MTTSKSCRLQLFGTTTTIQLKNMHGLENELRSGGRAPTQLMPDAGLQFRSLTFTGGCRVYRAGTKGPLLLLLHGGGYTGMSWAACTKALDTAKYASPQPAPSAPFLSLTSGCCAVRQVQGLVPGPSGTL